MKIKKQKITGGKQQFADKIINNPPVNSEREELELTLKGLNIGSLNKLIEINELTIVLDTLLAKKPNGELRNSILLLKNQLKLLRKDADLNLISYDDFFRKHSRLTSAIIDIVNSKM